jgi:hypothetical protein
MCMHECHAAAGCCLYPATGMYRDASNPSAAMTLGYDLQHAMAGPPCPATHQARALHDRLLAPVRHGHGQRGELRQHLSHLIAALAAAHVDDAVGVGVLGQGLADNGLAAAKGTRDGAGACSVSCRCEQRAGPDDAGVLAAQHTRCRTALAGPMMSSCCLHAVFMLQLRTFCSCCTHAGKPWGTQHLLPSCHMLHNGLSCCSRQLLSCAVLSCAVLSCCSPPSTEGNSASSTRWPVSSGVSASSFWATGLGERTGHSCFMQYFCRAGGQWG